MSIILLYSRYLLLTWI